MDSPNATPGQARGDNTMKKLNITYWIVTALFSALSEWT